MAKKTNKTEKVVAPSNPMLGIGSTIWMFDINRRVYPKPRSEYSGGPIYREHWRPVTIEGETSRSWVTSWYGKKVPKRGKSQGIAFTEAEVEADVWAKEHRSKIVRMVERCEIETLKVIAKAVCYTYNDKAQL
jgi:hypothetical protein